MSSKTSKQTIKEPKEDSPIIYIIIFFILSILTLVVITWVMDLYSKVDACVFNPSFPCFNDWTCQENCPTGPGSIYNECYANATAATGLSECLFGITSQAASYCIISPTGTTGTTGPSCDCPVPLEATPLSCLYTCSQDLAGLEGKMIGVCCCNEISNTACGIKDNGSGGVIGTGACAPITSS